MLPHGEENEITDDEEHDHRKEHFDDGHDGKLAPHPPGISPPPSRSPARS